MYCYGMSNIMSNMTANQPQETHLVTKMQKKVCIKMQIQSAIEAHAIFKAMEYNTPLNANVEFSVIQEDDSNKACIKIAIEQECESSQILRQLEYVFPNAPRLELSVIEEEC